MASLTPSSAFPEDLLWAPRPRPTRSRGLRDALNDGVDVRGYLRWGLLDNFEWHSDHAMTFGLVAVDRTTFRRTPEPSLAWLGDTARSNGRTL